MGSDTALQRPAVSRRTFRERRCGTHRTRIHDPVSWLGQRARKTFVRHSRRNVQHPQKYIKGQWQRGRPRNIMTSGGPARAVLGLRLEVEARLPSLRSQRCHSIGALDTRCPNIGDKNADQRHPRQHRRTLRPRDRGQPVRGRVRSWRRDVSSRRRSRQRNQRPHLRRRHNRQEGRIDAHIRARQARRQARRRRGPR